MLIAQRRTRYDNTGVPSFRVPIIMRQAEEDIFYYPVRALLDGRELVIGQLFALIYASIADGPGRAEMMARRAIRPCHDRRRQRPGKPAVRNLP